MLRITMTDKLHYPDLFTTINIDETRDHMTLEAKHLFDAVSGIERVVPLVDENFFSLFSCLTSRTDAAEVAQLIWHFENKKAQTIDHLALTLTFGRLAVGIEHRDLSQNTTEFRKSRIWGDVVYDYADAAKIPFGTTSEFENASFENNFYATTIAQLGLIKQITWFRDHQSESSEAIWPNAA
jgi:hypothetical protein